LPPQHYSAGRTVLIGDAASAFGPLLGQGANKAIEDAYLLSTLLKNYSSHMQTVLPRYEALRRARHQRFFDLEHLSAEALIHETPEALNFFEKHLPGINLVTMYQDMIPLVNAAACRELDEQMVM
jgi:2-polyprenyl-6-methoxyphenol hydroxylase-like FAD-dependent oxidoreductase